MTLIVAWLLAPDGLISVFHKQLISWDFTTELYTECYEKQKMLKEQLFCGWKHFADERGQRKMAKYVHSRTWRECQTGWIEYLRSHGLQGYSHTALFRVDTEWRENLSQLPAQKHLDSRGQTSMAKRVKSTGRLCAFKEPLLPMWWAKRHQGFWKLWVKLATTVPGSNTRPALQARARHLTSKLAHHQVVSSPCWWWWRWCNGVGNVF